MIKKNFLSISTLKITTMITTMLLFGITPSFGGLFTGTKCNQIWGNNFASRIPETKCSIHNANYYGNYDGNLYCSAVLRCNSQDYNIKFTKLPSCWILLNRSNTPYSSGSGGCIVEHS